MKMEINGEILEKLAVLEMACRSGAKRVELCGEYGMRVLHQDIFAR